MIITLNKKFYTEKCVKDSIEAFKEIFNAKLQSEGQEFRIEIKTLKPVEQDKLEGEFVNYCIGWMKQNEF